MPPQCANIQVCKFDCPDPFAYVVRLLVGSFVRKLGLINLVFRLLPDSFLSCVKVKHFSVVLD